MGQTEWKKLTRRCKILVVMSESSRKIESLFFSYFVTSNNTHVTSYMFFSSSSKQQSYQRPLLAAQGTDEKHTKHKTQNVLINTGKTNRVKGFREAQRIRDWTMSFLTSHQHARQTRNKRGLEEIQDKNRGQTEGRTQVNNTTTQTQGREKKIMNDYLYMGGRGGVGG